MNFAVHNCKEQQCFLPIQCLFGMEKSVSNFPLTFSGRLENIPKWNCKALTVLLKKAKILVPFKNKLPKFIVKIIDFVTF